MCRGKERGSDGDEGRRELFTDKIVDGKSVFHIFFTQLIYIPPCSSAAPSSRRRSAAGHLDLTRRPSAFAHDLVSSSFLNLVFIFIIPHPNK